MGDEKSPERVYKTFDGLLPDRVPVQDLIANIGVFEHYGRDTYYREIGHRLSFLTDRQSRF